MKRLLLIVWVVAAAVACRRSELDQTDEAADRLTLAAEQTAFVDESDFGAAAAEYQASKASNASKAVATAFQTDDTIGVFVHTTALIQAAGSHSANVRYTTHDRGATWVPLNALGGDLLNQTYFTTAYYPHQSDPVNPTAVVHSVAADQRNRGGAIGSIAEFADPAARAGAFERSDFMVSTAQSLTNPATDPRSTLQFKHAMSWLVLKFGVPTAIEGAAVDSVEKVVFKNTLTGATVNLQTGAVVPAAGTAKDITARHASGTAKAGMGAVYEAIAVPQTVGAGALLAEISCRMKDASIAKIAFAVSAQSPLGLQSGKKTTVTLRSATDAYFASELADLADGMAHAGMPLSIVVGAGHKWTLTSADPSWLTLSTASNGTYGPTVSGTSTDGLEQVVYVKVTANTAQAAVRSTLLALQSTKADNTVVAGSSYLAVQNFYAFASDFSAVRLENVQSTAAMPAFRSNQAWTASVEAGADWLKLAGRGGEVYGSGNPSSTFGPYFGTLAAGDLYFQATENPSADNRSAKVTFTPALAGQAPMVVTVVQSAKGLERAVKIGNLYWATGNLVADGRGGCRIGAPTDGGLYFQFGSLIGWKGGNQAYGGTGEGLPQPPLTTDATPWNPEGFSWQNDAQVWPTEFVYGPSGIGSEWPQNRTDLTYYFGYNAAPYASSGQNIRAYTGLDVGAYARQGVGDPCSYYLGAPWRMPTSAEYLTAANYSPRTTYGETYGVWFGPSSGWNAANSVWLVCSGIRNRSNGSFFNANNYGLYWSSTVYDGTSGFYAAINPTSVNPSHYAVRSFGMPVRCVRDAVQPAPSPVNPPSDDQTIQLNGTVWTTGNLISDGANGCKVGTPTDGGLYFQFGSLIGWSGGASGDGTGIAKTSVALAIKAKPSAYTGGTTWTTAGYFTAGSDAATVVTDTPDNAATGVGDPCRYYLGTPWRLPTLLDYATLGKFAANNSSWSAVGGEWSSSPLGGYFANKALFFTCNGYRHKTNGAVTYETISANYNSSTLYSSTLSYELNFGPTAVSPWFTGNNERTYGNSIRCVKDAPTTPKAPAASDYVEINGLRWAKGNLVADGPNNAKVGAPTDAGLYFQFGSLVGWAGGANWNGTGAPSTAPATTIVLRPNGYRGGTAWGTVGYFTAGTNANTVVTNFPDNGAAGVGDPCRFYLGGTWRLPTNYEYAALYSNVDNGATWASCPMGAWQASPTGAWAGTGAKSANPLNSVFFSAAGYRFNTTGALSSVPNNGYYHASVVYDGSKQFYVTFGNNSVYPVYNTSRQHAFSVRCVEEIPTTPKAPAADQIVEIGGLLWAKGNLVADGTANAKVGAPTDGGLYFQFGSLIGWSGGSVGDGTGVPAAGSPTAPLLTMYVRPTGYRGGNLWTSAGYFAAGKDPSTVVTNFPDDPAAGIGDPCRFYLGGKWRLPTQREYQDVLCRGYAGGADLIAAGAEWQASPAGMWFANKTLFFSACGYRQMGTSELLEVGTSYRSYASVISSSSGSFMLFGSNKSITVGSGARTIGRTIRCVSEK